MVFTDAQRPAHAERAGALTPEPAVLSGPDPAEAPHRSLAPGSCLGPAWTWLLCSSGEPVAGDQGSPSVTEVGLLSSLPQVFISL